MQSKEEFESRVAEYRNDPEKAVQELHWVHLVWEDYFNTAVNITEGRKLGLPSGVSHEEEEETLENCDRFFVLHDLYKDACEIVEKRRNEKVAARWGLTFEQWSVRKQEIKRQKAELCQQIGALEAEENGQTVAEYDAEIPF